MKTNAGLASSLSRFAFVVIFAVCLPVLHAQTPSPVYDRFMKVVPPADWVEKRPWELGDDRSLPFYSQPSEAVALIFGSNRPTYRTGFLEHLGQGDELKHRLEIELHAWPAEASRFYTMVSGGFAISKESNTVTVGPTFRPAQIHYLGKTKVGKAQLELVEYRSQDEINEAQLTQLQLRPEFLHSHAQILFGQAVFPNRRAFTLIACRFTTQDGTDWITPLLANTTPLVKSEVAAAEQADDLRDTISDAASYIASRKFNLAEEKLQSALAIAPEDDNALALKSEIAFQKGNYKDAQLFAGRAAAINPRNDRAHFNLGMALWKLGERRDAIKEWENVQQLSVLYPQITSTLQQRRADIEPASLPQH